MKISVIIPVYNSEQYLDRCIESVINQEYVDWEIIAVDDGSTDSSYEILKKYSLLDNRIHIYHQENLGPGQTRNNAIERATGEYLAFLDSDDWIDKDLYRCVVEKITDEDADIIFLDVLNMDTDGKVIKKELLSKYKDSSKEKILKHQLTGKFPWGGCRKVIRRKLIAENKIYYSHRHVGEEAIFSFKALFYANKISFVDCVYYNYTIRKASQSSVYDIDPYGPICEELRKTIIEMDLGYEFQKANNSFALTATVVSINRYVKYFGPYNAFHYAKKTIRKLKEKNSFDLDMDCLEPRVQFLVVFLKIGFVTPIIMASYGNTLRRKLRGFPE